MNDIPLLNITPNTSVDTAKSHPAYTTAIVAPGEINDRYRHSNPLQSMGYSTGSLEGLYMAAEILKNSGFDPYSYRGTHAQSLEMASRYYGCFAKSEGFDNLVTAEKIPQLSGYAGIPWKHRKRRRASGLIGAYRFPNDGDLVALDTAAKASYVKSVFSIEPIMFGKWRD